MKNLETEFKWDANLPRAFARMRSAVRRAAQTSAPKNLHITDVYLDHTNGAFEKQKIAFRVRNTDGNFEATFKTRTETVNGKAVRREETLPLPGVTNLADALNFLERKKTWKGLNTAGLKMQFEIRNRRQTLAVFFENAEMELAFDSCAILVCGRRVLMKEIELELKRGTAKKLDELAQLLSQKSGLMAAGVSKVQTACALAALWEGK